MDQKQIQIIGERISQNLKSKNVVLDENGTKEIYEKLDSFINEFGIVPYEAERKVLSDYCKKFNIPEEKKQVYSPQNTSADEVVNIADINAGDWVSVEVKVVALQHPNSDSISQSGVFADNSGAVRFVVFAKSDGLPTLELETWYHIDSAVVDSFRGALNLKLHSGSKITKIDDERCLIPSDPTPLSELKVGIVPCVRVKFVEEWESRSDKMQQSGLLADETGRAKFVLWKSDGKDMLEPGKVYSIFYASADEYMGRISLGLSTAMWIPEDNADISYVNDNSEEITGVLILISESSGVVKRCPVEGCNRVISKMNFCPIHDRQNDFKYDMRIKGVVDDGHKAYNVLIGREATEALLGISLDEAIERCENNPLGTDEILADLNEHLLDKYIKCSGSYFSDRVLVKSAEFVKYDSSVTIDLLNRAGGKEGE